MGDIIEELLKGREIIWDTIKERVEQMDRLLKERERIRKHITDCGVEIKKADIVREHFKMCAVDSAFYSLPLLDGYIEFYLSCVSYGVDGEIDKKIVAGEFAEKDIDVDVEYLYETDERVNAIFKMLSIVFELVMASKKTRENGYTTIIDRSVISIIAGLNQGYSQARKITDEEKKNNRLAKELVKNYRMFLDVFRFLLQDKVVFMLKRSNRDELLDLIGNSNKEFEWLNRYNDYIILLSVLEDGEYIELPFTRRYEFNLPEAQDILDTIKTRGKTVYLKGLNGGLFKIEYFGSNLPVNQLLTLSIQTVGNQNILTYRADEIARSILNSITGGTNIFKPNR